MAKKTRTFLAIFFACALLSFVINLASASFDNSGILSGFSKQVGVVRIEGIILDAEDIVKEINEYRDDEKTAAVILRINSPGGAVAPSQEIYRAIKESARKKPTVVSMGAVAASGGYYAASGASKIFASPLTLTGSIGVIMELPKYYELLKKIGVEVEVMTAGKLKDAGSPVRDLTGEERKYFDAILQDIHGQFIRDIAQGRDLDLDYVKSLSDGRIFTGNQALELGLVDELRSFEEVKTYVLETLNLPESTKFNENINHRNFFRRLRAKSPVGNLLPFRKGGAYFICERLL